MLPSDYLRALHNPHNVELRAAAVVFIAAAIIAGLALALLPA